jgi:hypothetical protein
MAADMRELTVGHSRYRIDVSERDRQWVARAIRDDNGDPFGIECIGATEADAQDRLVRWLEWQHEHTEALAALQQAERAYHRTITGSAFASATEGPSPLELQKEALAAVEGARIRLDEVRARKPE